MAESIDCFPVTVNAIEELVTLAQNESIDFVIVGPEVPLCLGIVDALKAVNIPAYGPTQGQLNLNPANHFAKTFSKGTIYQLQNMLHLMTSSSFRVLRCESGSDSGESQWSRSRQRSHYCTDD